MVLTRFSWTHGGRRVSICGSFSRWAGHYPMTLAEGSPTEFHAIFDLPSGVYQYRFLVDGMWRFDEQQPCLTDEYGMVNNVILVEEPEIATPMLHQGPHISRIMDVDDGISLYNASLSSHMPHEPVLIASDPGVVLSRNCLSGLLSSQTIYDIIPVSSKISIMDAQLPVKQAFRIMYEEGLAVVPLWNDRTATVTGMLTASDFILILRELQSNVLNLAHQELEMHSVSAWKEGKLRLYGKSNGPMELHCRSLIHVSDNESLKNVALKIVQNEISAVPIFKSSLQDETSMPLLNLASLPGILKFICQQLGEQIRSVPILQHSICRIPLGSWLPNIGRGSGHQLAILRRDSSLSTALSLLLEAKISSIPVVDDNGSFVDVYSRSDIMALAENDMYAHIQLDQMTMEHALQQVYQATGHRRCHTCSRSTSFLEVLEQLSDPRVRRVVVIDPRTRFVEGIISLRDVFTFFLS